MLGLFVRGFNRNVAKVFLYTNAFNAIVDEQQQIETSMMVSTLFDTATALTHALVSKIIF